jgi:hypothetical protein
MLPFSWVKILNVFLLVFWGLVVGYGMKVMFSYDAAPGKRALPAAWPRGITALAPGLHIANDGKDTLVMLVHPRCPCSRASVGNLETIMAHSKGRLDSFVIVYEPSAHPGSSWTNSDLVNSARQIPGVQTILDSNGALIAKFHGATSGQTLVYNSLGQLLFNGGITGSRGEYGDSAGTESIITLALYGTAEVHATPVYGCSLLNSQSQGGSTDTSRI